MDHKTAFELAYGGLPQISRKGSLESKESTQATERAAACIRACEGIPLKALEQDAVRAVIESAKLAQRVLGGRLCRIDPEAATAEATLREALRKLGSR